MKYFFKKIYLLFFLISFFIGQTTVFGKSNKIEYSRYTVTNYLSGIMFANQDLSNRAFSHLNKIRYLKNSHENFSIQFLRTLILLDKFDQAFIFSKNAAQGDRNFFESSLLMGLNDIVNENYQNAEKHFSKMNEDLDYYLLFEDFLRYVLLSWSQALQNNMQQSFFYYDKIPNIYNNLKKIQYSLLQCYFDKPEAELTFKNLVNNNDQPFSRYNFFLANYLLHKGKDEKAKKIIKNSIKKYSSNILLKQSENFILNKKVKEIKNIFNCKKGKDNIAEIFYVIANLHATQKDYQLSNFYLKLSLFLNKKFKPNKALLAENFFFQKKYNISKNIYISLKEIGPIYFWYAAKNEAAINIDTKGKKYSISILENEFNSLSNPDFNHYYEMANFYKDSDLYEESIKYYSLALKNIEKKHYLVPKILDRRGTSYERIGEWENAEKDLTESLRILPDQPYVLNYLAYSWIEKRINIEKSLEMLKRAAKLRKNDGYIIDSLGWAFYIKKNYKEAEKFLQKAVELMPLDPVINDHYADTLWMLNKNIQARYFWKYVLNLDETEKKLKESLKKKLIFGISKKL